MERKRDEGLNAEMNLRFVGEGTRWKLRIGVLGQVFGVLDIEVIAEEIAIFGIRWIRKVFWKISTVKKNRGNEEDNLSQQTTS